MLPGLRGLVAALALAFAAPGAFAQPRVHLSLEGDGTPRVRIEMPAGMDTVSFVRDESQRTHREARSAWKLDADCFAVAHDSLRRLRPGCGDAVIRLTWHGRMVDRMYPPVVKLASGGVLVFTQYLRALDERGRVMRWMVSAPEGGVAVARGAKGATLEIEGDGPEADGRGWIYLGPDRFREAPVGRILVDDGVPQELEAEVSGTAARLLDVFRAGLGPPEGPATLFVTWSRRDSPHREMQADVVPGGVMRVELSGAAWGGADAAARSDLRFLIAHEMAHVWNAGRYRPAPWAAPWISEGSAEMFAIAGLLALGELDEAAAADRLSVAYTRCALKAAGRAWTAMPERDRGDAPYTCGLVMHFAIAAAGGAREMPGGVLAFWRRAWERWPRYHEAVAQLHLEAMQRTGAAEGVREMLTLNTVPLAHSVRRLLHHAGVAVTRAGEVSGGMRAALAGHAFLAVMQGDCGGNAAFYMRADHILVAENLPCGALPAGMAVERLAEHDLLADPIGAIVAARRSCRESGRVPVGALDGRTVRPACRESALPDPDGIVSFEPRAVAAILLGPPPRR